MIKKKSFTLVELSIVLLTLSLLVGALLVGRSVIDRVKIQRIIFEMDYYEKAFRQFYDSYDVVPGNLGYETCIKHVEFHGCTATWPEYKCNKSHEDFCKMVQDKPTGFEGDNRMLRNDNEINVYSPMCQLASAKLIDKDVLCLNWYTSGYQFEKTYSNGLYHYKQHNIFPKSSFDSNVIITYHGFNSFDDGSSYKDNFNFYNMNSFDDYETSNKSFKYAVNRRNSLIFTSANSVCECTSSNQNCSCNKSIGALTSTEAERLDIKLDDGLPGSGSLLAYKSDFAHRVDANRDDVIKTCYDRNFKDVGEAHYLGGHNRRYGCNIIKVMKDL